MNEVPVSPNDVSLDFDFGTSVSYINESLKNPWGWRTHAKTLGKKVEFPFKLKKDVAVQIKTNYELQGWDVNLENEDTIVFMKK